MSGDKLIEAAKELGREHGESKGTFVKGLSISKYAAKRILEGYNNGDEETMDICPKPLSGEWAEDPTPMAILDEIANKVDDHHTLRGEDIDPDSDDVLDAYEEAYTEAFWGTVIDQCKEVVGE